MRNWYLEGTDWNVSCRRAKNFTVNVEEQDVYNQACLQADINPQITNFLTLDNIVGAANAIEHAHWIRFRSFF